MIVKPSVSFLTYDSDAQLIVDVQAILTLMAANTAIYATPSPTLAVIITALTNFRNALAAAADGGIALTAAKNTARAALVALVRNLGSYVQVTCNNNLDNLLLSGFQPQSNSRAPIGILPAPAGLTVTLGARSGELNAAVAPVYGAAIYNWEVMVQGQTTVLQKAQTTAASSTFDNLTPGTAYAIVCNCVGSAGPSDWTDPQTQIVV